MNVQRQEGGNFQLRYWLGIQLAVVFGFFVLALVLWGADCLGWLSITIGLLCTYFRVELAALASGLTNRKDLLVVTIVLLFLGIVLIPLQYLLKELYWYLQELFFGSRGTNIMWEFGRIALVATGVGLTWSLMNFHWVAKIRSRFVGVQQLHLAFFSVLLGSKFLKSMCVVFLPVLISLGMAYFVGTTLVVIGGFSWAEVFGEASRDLAEELQFTILFGGLLLSIIPTYYLSHRWWHRDVLTEALERKTSD